MTERTAAAQPATAPRWVTIFSPIARRLLGGGRPLGFNGLMTITGRTSGLPRTTPVAIIDHEGRRWVWAPWGDVHWVRNLRVAGRATITVRRHEEEVTRDRARPRRARGVLPRRPGPGRPDTARREMVHPDRRRGRSRRPGRGPHGRPVFELPPAR